MLAIISWAKGTKQIFFLTVTFAEDYANILSARNKDHRPVSPSLSLSIEVPGEKQSAFLH